MKKEVICGIATGLACAGLVALLPLEKRRDVLLVMGSVIPAHYVGFSIQAGNIREISFQILGALFFIALCFVGAWKLPLFLPLAIGLHGFWDLLHHSSRAPMSVKRWYPPYCAVLDWVLGACVLFFGIY